MSKKSYQPILKTAWNMLWIYFCKNLNAKSCCCQDLPKIISQCSLHTSWTGKNTHSLPLFYHSFNLFDGCFFFTSLSVWTKGYHEGLKLTPIIEFTQLGRRMNDIVGKLFLKCCHLLLFKEIFEMIIVIWRRLIRQVTWIRDCFHGCFSWTW